MDTIQSADGIVEYNLKLKSFVSKFFTSSKSRVIEVKAKKLVITNLYIESVREMMVGSLYVYSGLSAKSVDITIKVKKEAGVDPEEIIKAATSLIANRKVTKALTKFIPLFDSTSYSSLDTLSYKMTMVNPNIFYKVKIVQIKKDAHN